MTVVTRSEKGSALTRSELDGNFLETRRTELAFMVNDGAANNETVWNYAATRALSIPASLAGTVAKISSGFTGSFDLQKNGTVIGSIAFTNSAATLTLVGGATLASGDTLTLVAKGAYTFTSMAVTIIVNKI